MATLLTLPPEVDLMIAKHLSSDDITKVLQTCKTLSTSIWRNVIYERDCQGNLARNQAIRVACQNGDRYLLERAKNHGGASVRWTMPASGGLTFQPVSAAIGHEQFNFAVDMIQSYIIDDPETHDLAAILALESLVCGVGESGPYWNVEKLSAEQLADANTLFNILSARISNYATYHFNEPILCAAAMPTVPGPWFTKLLADYQAPMSMDHRDRMPWEILFTQPHYDVSSREPFSEADKAAITEKLLAIAKHCDLDSLHHQYDRQWCMLSMVENLVLEPQTDFAIAVFQILLSAGQLDINKRGAGLSRELGYGGKPRTMLELISYRMNESHGVSRNNYDEVWHRNGPIMIDMLLARGADSTIAARHSISSSSHYEAEPMILTLAKFGQSSVESAMEIVLKQHLEAREAHKIKSAANSRDFELGALGDAGGTAGHDGETSDDDDELSNHDDEDKYNNAEATGSEDDDTEFGSKIRRRRVFDVRHMLDINVLNRPGNNALHLACNVSEMSPRLVGILVQYGVDPAQCNGDGQNPLHALCANRNASPEAILEVVKALLGGLSPAIQIHLLISKTSKRPLRRRGIIERAMSSSKWLSLPREARPARLPEFLTASQIAQLRGHVGLRRWLEELEEEL